MSCVPESNVAATWCHVFAGKPGAIVSSPRATLPARSWYTTKRSCPPLRTRRIQLTPLTLVLFELYFETMTWSPLTVVVSTQAASEKDDGVREGLSAIST